MGKVTSMVEFNGGVGNLVGYKGRDGRNVIRHKVYDVKNAKTTLQMRRRVAWGNLVQVWSALIPHMEPAFESKTAGQTQFNAFMQLNVDGNNVVYLKKSEVRLNACIVAGVLIAEGSLPPIVMQTVAGGKVRSDINLDSITDLAGMTVGAVSHVIINNNAGWENGDQLTFIYAEQVVDADGITPKCKVACTKFVLDVTSSEMLADVCDIDMFSVVDTYLASKSTIIGGCAFIHSRRVDGSTKVSTTRLFCNNTLLETYTSRTAQLAAIKSYGGAKEKYLTPVGNEYLAPASDNP